MKFNRILEQYVRESEALTKIIVKVDPLNNSRKDYRDFDGYEGYILKENNNKWSVLFENIDMPVMDVPFSVIKVVDIPCDETFNNVRMFGLKAIEERRGLTMEIINKIQACNSIDFLEQYLKEEGLNDSEIKDVYKKALLSDTISENVIGTAGKIFRKAKKVVGTVLQPDYAIADLISKGRDKVMGKYNEIKDNIAQRWGSDATDKKAESQTGSGTETPNQRQGASGSIGYPRPPYQITSRVDNVQPRNYSRASPLMEYIKSGGVSNIFKYYKNTNNNSNYFHNTRTDDIIRIIPIIGSNDFTVQIGNLHSPAPDPDRSKSYFENNLRNEMAGNNIRFLNRSLSNLP